MMSICPAKFSAPSEATPTTTFDCRLYCCMHCNARRCTSNALSRHVKQAHPAAYQAACRFQCPVCSHRVPLRISILSHISRVHGSSPDLVRAIRESSPEPSPEQAVSSLLALALPQRQPAPASFRCAHCSCVFTNVNVLTSHLKADHPEEYVAGCRYGCPVPDCSLRFTKRDSLFNHIGRRHMNAPEYEAMAFAIQQMKNRPPRRRGPSLQAPPRAPSNAAASSSGILALFSASGPNATTNCPHCNAVVFTRVFSIHMQRMHKAIYRASCRFACPVPRCNYRVPLRSSLLQHVVRIHGSASLYVDRIRERTPEESEEDGKGESKARGERREKTIKEQKKEEEGETQPKESNGNVTTATNENHFWIVLDDVDSEEEESERDERKEHFVEVKLEQPNEA